MVCVGVPAGNVHVVEDVALAVAYVAASSTLPSHEKA
jgi:hypothetical protein